MGTGHGEDSEYEATKPLGSPGGEGGGEAHDTAGQRGAEEDAGHDSYIGRCIDNYEIKEALGEGSFGRVYRAQDVKLGRDVAIKFLKYSILSRDRELFRREARGLAALGKHPNIVQIHAWGEYENNHYFVLEYVPLSLGKLLDKQRGGLRMADAVRIITEAADGAHFAHEQGILHIDIKPDNILVEKAGGVTKLADFGLMRICQPGGAVVASQISGSPPYMAPEQVDNGPMDARTDVFALGVSLYQALSGQRPFEGSTAVEVMNRISQHEYVPLQERKPGIPEYIVQVVDTAIAHRPEDRFQTAYELAEALRNAEQQFNEVVSSSTIVSSRGSQSRQVRPRSRLFAGAALALALIGVSGLLLWQNMKSAQATPYLAQGRTALERDDLQTAEDMFGKALEEEPDKAYYGLGYTLLKQRRLDEAAAAFGRIQDPSLRAEGLAAIAWSRDGEAAEESLAAARTATSSSYLEALLAELDALHGKPDSAIERLSNLQEQDFEYEWQYAEALRTLGRSYLDMKRFEEASQVFQRLQTEESPAVSSIAAAYLELTQAQMKAQMDAGRREAIRNQVADLKKALDESQGEQDSRDTWRSRPFTSILLPVQCRGCQLARQTGLDDVLPVFLLPAFAANTGLQPLNRDLIDEVLFEQEISAQLRTGELALREIKGGRFMIECEFVGTSTREFINPTVINTESTVEIFPDRVDLVPPVDPEGVSQALAQHIWAAIRKAYPLRGYLAKKKDRFEIDIGADVGVVPGMRFDVGLADSKRLLPGCVVTVSNDVGPDYAEVVLESGTLDNAPGEGWVVVENRTEPPAGKGPSTTPN